MRESVTITVCLAAVAFGFPADTSLRATDEPDTQSAYIHMELHGNVLDTFNGTLSENPGKNERVSVPFSLTAAEIDTILKQAVRFDFFALPDTIPDKYGVSRGSDRSPDLLRIKWGEQDHMVVWYYPFSMEDGRRGFLPLRLSNFIWELAYSKVNPDFRAPYSGDEKRIGYAVKHIRSHFDVQPRRMGDPWPKYGYLDVYDQGQLVKEIIVIYRPDLEPPPDDTGRLIVLIGDVGGIVEGEPGEKGGYTEEWIYVREWHYVEDEQ